MMMKRQSRREKEPFARVSDGPKRRAAFQELLLRLSLEGLQLCSFGDALLFELQANEMPPTRSSGRLSIDTGPIDNWRLSGGVMEQMGKWAPREQIFRVELILVVEECPSLFCEIVCCT